MYLGERMRGGKLTGEAVIFDGEEHILIIGPTRSGKSRRLLVPNLIRDNRSALVVDVKGELFNWTAAHRESRGHNIITLDPFGIAGRPSDGFNPLASLDPLSTEFVDDATGFAEAMIQIPDKEPHWAESARDVVAGLIMYECCKNGPKASLKNVRRHITGSTGDLREIAIDAVSSAEIMSGWHYAIANKLRCLVEITDENRELLSIISTAKTQTQFLDSDLVSADLEKQSIDFSDMKRKPTTVYLILPPKRLHTHYKWLRLVIDAVIRDLQKQLRQPGESEVLFYLDEFAQLGTMRNIEISMSLNAGYGIKVIAVVQHLGQLKQHYAENWETFSSGGLIATFAPRDVLTSEHLSQLSGQEWIQVSGSSVTNEGGGSVSLNQQLAPSIMPHEFRRMPKGMIIAFIPTEDEGQVMRRIMTRDAVDLPGMIPQRVRDLMAR